jgi:hypothetical protein
MKNHVPHALDEQKNCVLEAEKGGFGICTPVRRGGERKGGERGKWKEEGKRKSKWRKDGRNEGRRKGRGPPFIAVSTWRFAEDLE